MQKFLNRLRAMSRLGNSEMDAVEGACRDVIRLEADTDLVREGEPAEHVHVLLEGWACRYVLLPEGGRQIPALLLPGDVADLDALLAQRRPYAVATLTACEVAVLSCQAVHAAMAQYPALGAALLMGALHENVIMTHRNVSLGRQSARERVAHLLCELANRLSDDDATTKGAYALPLTQAELGDVLGLSTVHVNRVLQSLRADALIRVANRRLEVLDWNGLGQVAGFHCRPAHADASRSSRSGAWRTYAQQPMHQRPA